MEKSYCLVNVRTGDTRYLREHEEIQTVVVDNVTYYMIGATGNLYDSDNHVILTNIR